MTKRNQVFKCEICGNIVEVLHVGAGELVCCGAPMKLQEENTVDPSTSSGQVAAQEKHVPVIEKTDTGCKVTVGEVAHPMEDAHFIEWIELVADGRVCRKELRAGDEPIAEFCVKNEKVSVRAYCNVHGLWSVV